MTLDDAGVVDGTCIPLSPGAPFPPGVDGFLHLAGMPTLKLPAGSLGDVPEILTGQVAVQAVEGGARLDATGLQIPGVLDDLYATDTDLGIVWDGGVPTIKLWAPTAKSVAIQVFDDADPATTPTVYPMTSTDGVWSATGDASWNGKYYLFQVEVFVPSTGAVETNVVTDPYSVSLSTNSARSQIIDLSDPGLAPAGWDALTKPDLARPEDVSIYELHVRDFSIFDDTVEPAQRGTFAAFTDDDSNGMAALVRPRRRRSQLRAPASGVRHRNDRGGRRAAPGTRLGCARRLRTRFRRAAGGSVGHRRTRRVQLGLRPLPLHDSGGFVLHRSRMARPASSSSARWCSRSTTPAYGS